MVFFRDTISLQTHSHRDYSPPLDPGLTNILHHDIDKQLDKLEILGHKEMFLDKAFILIIISTKRRNFLIYAQVMLRCVTIKL